MRTETYWKKENGDWKAVKVTLKNDHLQSCVCGLYMSKDWWSKPIENCIHCTQQKLFSVDEK